MALSPLQAAPAQGAFFPHIHEMPDPRATANDGLLESLVQTCSTVFREVVHFSARAAQAIGPLLGRASLISAAIVRAFANFIYHCYADTRMAMKVLIEVIFYGLGREEIDVKCHELNQFLNLIEGGAAPRRRLAAAFQELIPDNTRSLFYHLDADVLRDACVGANQPEIDAKIYECAREVGSLMSALKFFAIAAAIASCCRATRVGAPARALREAVLEEPLVFPQALPLAEVAVVQGDQVRIQNAEVQERVNITAVLLQALCAIQGRTPEEGPIIPPIYAGIRCPVSNRVMDLPAFDTHQRSHRFNLPSLHQIERGRHQNPQQNDHWEACPHPNCRSGSFNDRANIYVDLLFRKRVAAALTMLINMHNDAVPEARLPPLGQLRVDDIEHNEFLPAPAVPAVAAAPAPAPAARAPARSPPRAPAARAQAVLDLREIAPPVLLTLDAYIFPRSALAVEVQARAERIAALDTRLPLDFDFQEAYPDATCPVSTGPMTLPVFDHTHDRRHRVDLDHYRTLMGGPAFRRICPLDRNPAFILEDNIRIDVSHQIRIEAALQWIIDHPGAPAAERPALEQFPLAPPVV